MVDEIEWVERLLYKEGVDEHGYMYVASFLGRVQPGNEARAWPPYHYMLYALETRRDVGNPQTSAEKGKIDNMMHISEFKITPGHWPFSIQFL